MLRKSVVVRNHYIMSLVTDRRSKPFGDLSPPQNKHGKKEKKGKRDDFRVHGDKQVKKKRAVSRNSSFHLPRGAGVPCPKKEEKKRKMGNADHFQLLTKRVH